MAKQTKRSRNNNAISGNATSESPVNDTLSPPTVGSGRLDWLIVFLGVLLAFSFGVLLEQIRALWLESNDSSSTDVRESEGRGVARIILPDLKEYNDTDKEVEAEIMAFVDRNEPFVCRFCLPPASLGGWWDDDANLIKVIGADTRLLVRVAQRNNIMGNNKGLHETPPTQFRRTTAPGMQGGIGSAYQERNMTAAEFFSTYNTQGSVSHRETVKEHLYLAQIDIVSMLPDLLPYVYSSAPPPNLLLESIGPTPSASRRPFSMYLGAGLRTLQTHYDSFENVVCVVSGGSKTFALYDPMTSSKLLYVDRSVDGNGSPVPPDTRDDANFPLSKYALPSTVTLHAGDCLYLPVYWYHSVTSSQERTISLNWWREPNPNKMSLLEHLFCGKDDYGASAKCE